MISEGKIILVAKARHFAWFISIALSLLLTASVSFALGLGEIRVRSHLGQSLLAHSDVLGSDFESLNTNCLRARVVTLDGVFLSSVNVTVHQRQSKRALSFTTRQTINEPAVTLVIDINCETQLHREFSILLDPPDATPSNAAPAKEDSPFSALPQEAKKVSTANEPTDTAASSSKPKANKQKSDAVAVRPNSPKLEDVPVVEPKKTSKKSNKPTRDVLKLSDEVILPELPAGLRMSDVLSTDAGRQLVENNEELRAAQARMAAILRDEAASTASAVSKPNDLAEIASLKRETENLRKQSALDKSALEELQNKSQFDLWLVLLAIVAVVAILVIVFLLFYIRKNMAMGKATWWQGTDGADIDEEIVNAIESSDALENDSRGVSGFRPSEKAETNKGSHSKPVDFDSQEASLPAESDSGFQRTPTLEETNSSIFNFFSPRGSSVKVEEISDVTQEAEFWISMNDPLRAIEILQAQERIEHPDSPVPWLFLLDLYRTVKDAERYNQLRDRFIVHFNANIPEFEVDLALLPMRCLEDFEHLLGRICALWGTHEIIPYLESLLVDDREGKRAGFDLPVYRDILMLLGIAHELERMHSIDVETQDMLVATRRAQPSKVDPVSEAEFGTIEFESIDFHAIDLSQPEKKN
jgi:pilus assembly protein FimV